MIADHKIRVELSFAVLNEKFFTAWLKAIMSKNILSEIEHLEILGFIDKLKKIFVKLK